MSQLFIWSSRGRDVGELRTRRDHLAGPEPAVRQPGPHPAPVPALRRPALRPPPVGAVQPRHHLPGVPGAAQPGPAPGPPGGAARRPGTCCRWRQRSTTRRCRSSSRTGRGWSASAPGCCGCGSRSRRSAPPSLPSRAATSSPPPRTRRSGRTAPPAGRAAGPGRRRWRTSARYFERNGTARMAMAYYYQEYILGLAAPQPVPMTDVAIALDLSGEGAISDYKKMLQGLHLGGTGAPARAGRVPALQRPADARGSRARPSGRRWPTSAAARARWPGSGCSTG